MVKVTPAFLSRKAAASLKAEFQRVQLPPDYEAGIFDYAAWRERAGFHRDTDVALELDVSRQTLINWRKTGFPRIARLALYTLEHMPEKREWIYKSSAIHRQRIPD